MLKNRAVCLVYALATLLLLAIIARNWYFPYVNHRLIAAIEAQDLPAVRALLVWGANPNARKPLRTGDVGSSALSLAITPSALSLAITPSYTLSRAQEEIACLLIRHGAITREIDRTEYSTRYLENACSSGSLVVARCLLEHGADPNLIDSEHATPLDKALEYANADKTTGGYRFTDGEIAQRRRTGQALVQLLREHGGRVNLWQAALLNDVTALRTALDAGTPIDSASPLTVRSGGSAGTPLMIASEAGNLDAVRLLLDRGTNMNVLFHPSHWENGPMALSPLNAAISQRHLEVARLLVARGADVNLKSSEGVSYAPGADPDLLGLTGSGPLSRAAGILPSLVPDLLRSGADINADDGAPLCQAILHKQQAVVTLLLAHGARVQGRQGNAALAAALRSMPELVPILLAKGADAHDTERSYRSLIRLAVQYGRTDVIPQLIHAGANVNKRDYQGTALLEAISHAPSLVQVLLDAGADPNLPNREGVTPLMVSAQVGNGAAARLLLAHRVSVNAHPPYDHTALWYARRHNHPDVAGVLQQARGIE